MAKKKSDREAEIEQLIKDVERIGKAAEARRSWTAALGATTRAATLKEELHRLRELQRINACRDPLKRVRAQQTLALGEGSFVAAAKLAAVEGQLVAAMADADARKAEAELAGLGVDDLVSIICESIPAMPPEAKARIAFALGFEHYDEFEDGDA